MSGDGLVRARAGLLLVVLLVLLTPVQAGCRRGQDFSGVSQQVEYRDGSMWCTNLWYRYNNGHWEVKGKGLSSSYNDVGSSFVRRKESGMCDIYKRITRALRNADLDAGARVLWRTMHGEDGDDDVIIYNDYRGKEMEVDDDTSLTEGGFRGIIGRSLRACPKPTPIPTPTPKPTPTPTPKPTPTPTPKPTPTPTPRPPARHRLAIPDGYNQGIPHDPPDGAGGVSPDDIRGLDIGSMTAPSTRPVPLGAPEVPCTGQTYDNMADYLDAMAATYEALAIHYTAIAADLIVVEDGLGQQCDMCSKALGSVKGLGFGPCDPALTGEGLTAAAVAANTTLGPSLCHKAAERRCEPRALKECLPEGAGVTEGPIPLPPSTEREGEKLLLPIPGMKEDQDKSYASDTGMDAHAPVGTPIQAVADGALIYSEEGHTPWNRPPDTPNTILIRLDKPVTFKQKTYYFVWYAHLASLAFEVKDGGEERPVRRGERLGTTGIGNKVPHVHFGIIVHRSQGPGLFMKPEDIHEYYWGTASSPSADRTGAGVAGEGYPACCLDQTFDKATNKVVEERWNVYTGTGQFLDKDCVQVQAAFERADRYHRYTKKTLDECKAHCGNADGARCCGLHCFDGFRCDTSKSYPYKCTAVATPTPVPTATPTPAPGASPTPLPAPEPIIDPLPEPERVRSSGQVAAAVRCPLCVAVPCAYAVACEVGSPSSDDRCDTSGSCGDIVRAGAATGLRGGYTCTADPEKGDPCCIKEGATCPSSCSVCKTVRTSVVTAGSRTVVTLPTSLAMCQRVFADLKDACTVDGSDVITGKTLDPCATRDRVTVVRERLEELVTNLGTAARELRAMAQGVRGSLRNGVPPDGTEGQVERMMDALSGEGWDGASVTAFQHDLTRILTLAGGPLIRDVGGAMPSAGAGGAGAPGSWRDASAPYTPTEDTWRRSEVSTAAGEEMKRAVVRYRGSDEWATFCGRYAQTAGRYPVDTSAIESKAPGVGCGGPMGRCESALEAGGEVALGNSDRWSTTHLEALQALAGLDTKKLFIDARECFRYATTDPPDGPGDSDDGGGELAPGQCSEGCALCFGSRDSHCHPQLSLCVCRTASGRHTIDLGCTPGPGEDDLALARECCAAERSGPSREEKGDEGLLVLRESAVGSDADHAVCQSPAEAAKATFDVCDSKSSPTGLCCLDGLKESPVGKDECKERLNLTCEEECLRIHADDTRAARRCVRNCTLPEDGTAPEPTPDVPAPDDADNATLECKQACLRDNDDDATAALTCMRGCGGDLACEDTCSKERPDPVLLRPCLEACVGWGDGSANVTCEEGCIIKFGAGSSNAKICVSRCGEVDVTCEERCLREGDELAVTGEERTTWISSCLVGCGKSPGCMDVCRERFPLDETARRSCEVACEPPNSTVSCIQNCTASGGDEHECVRLCKALAPDVTVSGVALTRGTTPARTFLANETVRVHAQVNNTGNYTFAGRAIVQMRIIGDCDCPTCPEDYACGCTCEEEVRTLRELSVPSLAPGKGIAYLSDPVTLEPSLANKTVQLRVEVVGPDATTVAIGEGPLVHIVEMGDVSVTHASFIETAEGAEVTAGHPGMDISGRVRFSTRLFPVLVEAYTIIGDNQELMGTRNALMVERPGATSLRCDGGDLSRLEKSGLRRCAPYREFVERELEIFDLQGRIDPLMVMALMMQESSCNPDVNCGGIMQVDHPCRVEKDSPLYCACKGDAELGINLGTKLLRDRLDRAVLRGAAEEEALTFVLFGYNRGMAAMDDAIKNRKAGATVFEAMMGACEKWYGPGTSWDNIDYYCRRQGMGPHYPEIVFERFRKACGEIGGTVTEGGGTVTDLEVLTHPLSLTDDHLGLVLHLGVRLSDGGGRTLVETVLDEQGFDPGRCEGRAMTTWCVQERARVRLGYPQAYLEVRRPTVRIKEAAFLDADGLATARAGAGEQVTYEMTLENREPVPFSGTMTAVALWPDGTNVTGSSVHRIVDGLERGEPLTLGSPPFPVFADPAGGDALAIHVTVRDVEGRTWLDEDVDPALFPFSTLTRREDEEDDVADGRRHDIETTFIVGSCRLEVLCEGCLPTCELHIDRTACVLVTRRCGCTCETGGG